MIRIRLTMRLYKRHDADLLCLYKQKNFSLQNAIKKAVIAYLDGDEKIDFPDCNSELAELPSTAQFHLYLSLKSEEDARIKSCISQIPMGFKNSFLKNVTRYYLKTPAVFEIKDKHIQIKQKGIRR